MLGECYDETASSVDRRCAKIGCMDLDEYERQRETYRRTVLAAADSGVTNILQTGSTSGLMYSVFDLFTEIGAFPTILILIHLKSFFGKVTSLLMFFK